MTVPPGLAREGCCADVRKSCTFHEGHSDGWDAHARGDGALVPHSEISRMLHLLEYSATNVPQCQEVREVEATLRALLAGADAPVRQVTSWYMLRTKSCPVFALRGFRPPNEDIYPRDDLCNEPAGFIDLETGAFLDGAMAGDRNLGGRQ